MTLTRLKLALTLATTSFLVLVAGCGGRKTTIEGEVTFGGQPIDGGAISLLPKDGKEVAAGARIVGGKYVITSKAERLPPGTYKVVINWLKPTGKKVKNENDDNQLVDETQEDPAGVQSKLTVEITSGSNSGKNFELKAGGIVAAPPAARRRAVRPGISRTEPFHFGTTRGPPVTPGGLRRFTSVTRSGTPRAATPPARRRPRPTSPLRSGSRGGRAATPAPETPR